MTWALQGEGAGKTAILTYTMPFWLLLMAWVFLGERLKGFQWVAVVVALAGLILVLAPWEMKGGWSPLMAVGGALCWALSAIVAKLLRRRHEVDLLSLTAWQLFLGSLPLVVVAAATWSPPVWSGMFIYGLAFTVLAGNCLAWILWLYILNALPAGTAGLGMLLTPVIGITASWIALGERPGGIEGAGMLLIVGALLLTVAAEIAQRKKTTVTIRKIGIEHRQRVAHVAEERRHLEAGVLGDGLDREVRGVAHVGHRAHHHRAAGDGGQSVAGASPPTSCVAVSAPTVDSPTCPCASEVNTR